jgi:DNA-binding CsgD family transcriptional regulator/sugar-specific transcriptional regulator TrmB
MSDEHGSDDHSATTCRHLTHAGMEVYRFLTRGPATLAECVAATGRAPETVTEALDYLADARLVEPQDGEPRRWVATRPRLAFVDFLARLRAEYTKLSERTTSLSAVLDELQAAMLADTNREQATPGIERILASDGLQETLTELVAGARHSVRAMHPTVASDDAVRVDFSADRALYERGIEIRSIYPHTARRQREGLNYLRHVQQIGGQCRTTVSVPSRVVLVDDLVAVLQSRSCVDGVLIARDPNIVAFFGQFFEDAWDSALPVSEYDYDEDVWREIELLVLVELSTGRSDEAIARRLDISTRTLRRYITGLYERFGVTTRFQLGVAAARAGVLSGEPKLG